MVNKKLCLGIIPIYLHYSYWRCFFTVLLSRGETGMLHYYTSASVIEFHLHFSET